MLPPGQFYTGASPQLDFDQLSVWGKFKDYIRTGKLIISETSFGETTAKAGISDDLNDEFNSIYAPDAARERRVEIVEIKGN